MKTSHILKATIIITAIGFISAFLLSLMNKITKEPILKQEQEKKLSALTIVLPGYTVNQEHTVNIDGQQFIYWDALKVENSITHKAWAFIAEKNGYSSVIQSIVGIDEAGTIIGFTILSQSETPGLGARCTEVISNETFIDHFITKSCNNVQKFLWFQEQFIGVDAHRPIDIIQKGDWFPTMREELLQKNAITAITGATITTKAVTKSIEEGVKKLHKALALQEVKK